MSTYRTRLSTSFATQTVPAFSNSISNCTAFASCNLIFDELTDRQFATWYEGVAAPYEIMISWRAWPNGAWTTVGTGITGGSGGNGGPDPSDSHNQCHLAVDGDGYLWLAVGYHGEPLRLHRSTAPGGVTFGAALTLPIDSGSGSLENVATYLQMLTRSNGNLLLLWRTGGSSNGDTYLYELTKTTGALVASRKVFDGQGNRSAYPHLPKILRLGSGTDRLCLAFAWREAIDYSATEGLYYVQSDDQFATATTVSGAAVTVPITRAISDAAANCRCYVIPSNSGLSNVQALELDSDNRPHVVAMYDGQQVASGTPGGTQLFNHYWNGSAWQRAQLSSFPWTFTYVNVADPAGMDSLCAIPFAVFYGGRLHALWNINGSADTPEQYSDPSTQGLWVFSSGINDFASYTATRLRKFNTVDWSPSYDQQLWERRGVLQMFHQAMTFNPPIAGGAKPAQVLTVTLPTQTP